MEEGVAFCPNCNAPQIRVTGLPNRPATPPLPPDNPEQMQPPAERVELRPEQRVTTPPHLDWSRAMPGALLGALLVAMAMVVPFAAPVLLMATAGLFSAAMYQRRSGTQLTPGLGARAGMVGGVLGFAVMVAMLALQFAAGGERLITLLRQTISEQIARSGGPRAQQMMEQFLTPGGLAMLVGIAMLFFLAFALVCSALGGVVAAYLFGKSKRHL
ncbi:MAG: hypothetical protein ACE14L_05700 [Terriglobales bacterium]